MENKTINTPSGYVVTLKASFTYGQFLEIQQLISQNMEFNPTTGATSSLGTQGLFDAKEKAREMLIVSIFKDNTPFTGKLTDLPIADGLMVDEEIDKLITPDKKKASK